MRPSHSRRLVGLAVLALLGGGAAAASAATPGADCCFAPAVAVSDPTPAGDVLFGPVADGLPHVIVRKAANTLLAGGLADGRFAAPIALGSWPYRDLQLGDVDGDVLDDLVGEDGAGTVVVAHATATGFDPPVPFAQLPRAYSVLRVGDTNGDEAADVVGLDPRSRAIRVLQAPGTTDAATLDVGRWPKGFSFLLTDLDRDGLADAIGVDAGGRVHVGFNQSTGFSAAHADWHVAAHVTLTVADVTGDGRADLVYRRRGSDVVDVRRTYEAASGGGISTGFHSARRWGRWDRRLPLTTAYLSGPRASLVARDPRTGRILVARST
jgi:hypothetical protein